MKMENKTFGSVGGERKKEETAGHSRFMSVSARPLFRGFPSRFWGCKLQGVRASAKKQQGGRGIKRAVGGVLVVRPADVPSGCRRPSVAHGVPESRVLVYAFLPNSPLMIPVPGCLWNLEVGPVLSPSVPCVRL